MEESTMTLPKHNSPTEPRLTKVSSRGSDKYPIWARAPYNFVPLPEKIIASSPVGLDKYTGNTGWIKCRLQTISPLYVRGMQQKDEFRETGEKAFHELPDNASKARRAQFFSRDESHPFIPGSSLRGMLRSLVEVITNSKVQPVSKEPIVYRAVADGTKTALGIYYKERLDANQVRAGYIEMQGGEWHIRPAHLVGSFPFGVLRVAEGKETAGETLSELKARLSNNNWQGCQNAFSVDATGAYITAYAHEFADVSVGSGFVLVVTDQTPGLRASKKRPELGTGKNQYVFGLPDMSLPNEKLLEIPHDMIRRYREQLSDAQKKLLGNDGVLRPNQPVFYLVDNEGHLVFFGHARHFRLPYSQSASDLVPTSLNDDSVIDMAEAMFGFVRSAKVIADKLAAHASRIFVSDAVCALKMAEALLPNNENLNRGFSWFTPKVLSSPKPTTFQHYLVQDANRGHEPDCKENLSFYDTPSPSDTVIRGSKQYWHKPNPLRSKDWQFENGRSTKREHRDKLDQFQRQLTGIQPIKPNITFEFKIRFENLRDEELGALLWSLSLPAGHHHKLGMGKPLGLGTVRIDVDEIGISKRNERYSSLLDSDDWTQPEESPAKNFVQLFEDHVSKNISGGGGTLTSLPRIQTLLKMLSYPGPDAEWTRYMEIERTAEFGEQKVNEYAERPVLPDPFHIADTDCVGHRRAQPCVNLPEIQRLPFVPLVAGPDQKKINGIPEIPEEPSAEAESFLNTMQRERTLGEQFDAVVTAFEFGNFICKFGEGEKDFGKLSKKNVPRNVIINVGDIIRIRLSKLSALNEWLLDFAK
jgi:CRISPR-associated protein (TIGR03986 family)